MHIEVSQICTCHSASARETPGTEGNFFSSDIFGVDNRVQAEQRSPAIMASVALS